jgi:hypothetical protein
MRHDVLQFSPVQVADMHAAMSDRDATRMESSEPVPSRLLLARFAV